MPRLPFPTLSSVALLAVGDPSRDRTVYATIVLLAALGFALILLAVWLLRTTRPDPEVLAPLERMGQRKWRRADPVWQRRHLDEVRPGGADPLEPSTAPPATDADFERGPQPIGFDDLVASDATSADAPVGLPAPTALALAVDEPLDVHPRDAPTPGEGTPVITPDTVTGDGATGAREHGDAMDDAGSDGDAGRDGDDDDEDITGEQDTDDFLAVLDRVDEPATDVDPPADSNDRVAEPDVESEADTVVEPDVEPEAEMVVDLEPEAVVDSDVESEPETIVEPDVVPESETAVESEPEAVVEPDVEAVVEPVGPTASTSNDDEAR